MPFWTDPEDVSVDIKDCDVSVHVRGSLDLRRTYWRNACAHCDDVNKALGFANMRPRDGLALPGDARALHAEVSGVPQNSNWLNSSLCGFSVSDAWLCNGMSFAKASRPRRAHARLHSPDNPPMRMRLAHILLLRCVLCHSRHACMVKHGSHLPMDAEQRRSQVAPAAAESATMLAHPRRPTQAHAPTT